MTSHAQDAGRDRVIISWIPYHGRSDGLGRALDARPVWSPWARSGNSRWRTALGWARSTVRTVRVVARLPRGSLVVVMVPPVFALAVVLALQRWRRLRVVADLHSAAVDGSLWTWSLPWLHRLIVRCDAVLVTNTSILGGTEMAGVQVVVVHDPPLADLDPRVSAAHRSPSTVRPDPPVVVFPSSGADDEPLAEVAELARRLEGEALVVVTGRGHGLRPGPGLHLPGFLPAGDYAELLRRSAAVLALTRRPNTMQRAAYEALEVGRPIICSDTAVLRDFFGDAATYCDNTPAGLERAVRSTLEHTDHLLEAQLRVRAHREEELDRAVSTILGAPVP